MKPRRSKKSPRSEVRKSRIAVAGASHTAHELKDSEVEDALRRGEHTILLDQYFGEREKQELQALARQAASVRMVRGAPRVLILPGIMGSKLGWPSAISSIFDDILWLDPIDIAAGNLLKLALRAGDGLEPLGVILLAYLKLKLRLKIAGYDADFFPYDWRLSLPKLGALLAKAIDRESASEIHLVAHSMGGLVARAALAKADSKIKNVVMLGTPNFGSFAPVQAFRGTYDVVRKVAWLDPFHKPEELATRVFNGFPGLYHMLPSSKKFSQVPLYDLSAWPKDGPRPDQRLLENAARDQELLPEKDKRFVLIAGINQPTVTGMRVENGEFVYEESTEGDGTVPLAFAQLPGTPVYYVDESHGSLPNNGLVAKAVIDLLGSGQTSVLPDQWTPTRRGSLRARSDSQLRREIPAEDRSTELSQTELRHLLDGLVSPDSRKTPAETPATALEPAAAAPTEIIDGDRIVVGRRRQHRIDVTVACGSLTEVDARAYVLGIYQDVTPSGAARDVDDRLNGAVAEFSARRMFTGRMGEIFMIPAGRNPLRTESVLFVGLGPINQFGASDVQKLVGEHTIRSLIRTRVEDFATVLPGGGSGVNLQSTLENLFTGFIRGLLDSDDSHGFRGITICEIDPQKCREIRREILRLASTPLFKDLEITFNSVVLPSPPESTEPRRGLGRVPDPVYLLIQAERPSPQTMDFRASLLGAGGKATVVAGSKAVDKSEIDKLLSQISGLGDTGISKFGDELARKVLPGDLLSLLQKLRERHVVVVHDAESSRIPWETLRVGGEGSNGWYPALEGGLSRKYSTSAISIAKWLEERRQQAAIEILLIVNPTENLPGAEKEGATLIDLFKTRQDIKFRTLRRREATKAGVLREIQSGRFDIIHYAGHAGFDETTPARSGILCYDGPLTGGDFQLLSNLPSLLFANACESARVRKLQKPSMRLSVGLAESFLLGGLANYVGTYWSVGDDSAAQFSKTFYSTLVNGETVGRALLAARASVSAMKSHDWADYIHYGSHDFVLKNGNGAPAGNGNRPQ